MVSVLPPLPDVGRTPPEDVVRDLRHICPTIALFNVREDYWWLLNHRPTTQRRQYGERVKEKEWNRLKLGLSVRKDALMMGDLCIDGWELWGRYRWRGDPPREQLLADLSAKVDASERALDAAFEAGQRAEEGRADAHRTAVLRDFIQTDGLAAYRRAARGRVIVGGDLKLPEGES